MDMRKFLYSMFQVGCIGFGGGSALIPVIEREVVDRQGLDKKQNIEKDVIVASITPGALPVEIAASIGRRRYGVKGMVAGAVMMALPGAVMTVLLVAVLSAFQERILSVVNMISIGVSIFIMYLLYSYIRTMLKECGKEGTARKFKAILLMLGILGMSFFISTVEILVLVFFGIFFTKGNYCRKNMTVLTGVSALYILTHAHGLPWDFSAYERVVNLLMLILAGYGIFCNIHETKWQGEKDWKEIAVDIGTWILFAVVLMLPVFFAYQNVLEFFEKSILSAWVSFGGGDAYLTIADGFFVEGGMISAQQYYSHIVPAVNVLPGSILCKTLSAVGYYVGFNLSGKIWAGVLFAITGFACSIAASCSSFMLVYHLYDYLMTLHVFLIIRRWIRPMIGGLLMKIMITLCMHSLQIIQTLM